MKALKIMIPLLLVALGVGVVSVQAAVVYSNDFSGGAGGEWSTPQTATANGENFLGASASGFGNMTNTLSLSSLPSHEAISISFDLYVINSMDGNGPEGGAGDPWQLTADGTSVIYTNFANYTGLNSQAYPNELPPYGSGGSFAPRTGAYANGHLGYGSGDFGDATYRFSFTIPHTAATLTLNYISSQNQSPGDEGWGLDNVVVQTVNYSSIPTLSEWGIVFMSLLLAGSGLWMMRRRQMS
ncbi:MAG: IPTL-CTERM sorting domain-containing protein [Desulfobacteraceae bacterium]|nr:MAG: IPTL-CTERM sorting domain-containing protein [Desulfobacteraceae bacterium]